MAVISVAGVKIWTERKLKGETYENAAKKISKLHDENGKFKYETDGFHFTKNKETEFIRWNDIIEVNSFKIPTGKWKNQTGIEVITKTKSYEFNHNNTSGMEKFGDKLFENLPDWTLNAESVRVNNYGVEKANLYKKTNIV